MCESWRTVLGMDKQQNNTWIAKALVAGSLSAFARHFTLIYVLPVGAPVVTALIGYFSGIPWFYIWLGALASVTFVITSLLRADEWLARRRIQDKLVFSSLRVGRNIHGPGMFLGMILANQAQTPLAVKFFDVRTVINGRVPLKRQLEKVDFSVPEDGFVYLDDHIIDLGSDQPEARTVEGFVEFKVKYGRSADKLNYELVAKKQVVLSFNDDGLFAGCSWHDAS